MMSDIGEAAARFKNMAEQIDKQDGPFGGAFVIVPPTDGGQTLETLILDNRQDAAQFWVWLKTKCENEITRIDLQSRQQNTFGRR